MKITIFWDMMSYNQVDMCRHLEERQYTYTSVDGVTSQKTIRPVFEYL
jgi:hypothetical protein